MKTLQEIEHALSHSPEVANPPGPFYSGAEAPCRFEAEVYHCVVRGRIPPEIDGTYYRCMPDALWAPLYDDDVCVPASLLSPPDCLTDRPISFINGDGAIDALRVRRGRADFKQRFVRTEKFLVERAARRAVYGRYRNRHTDDPRVRHRVHSTANTHVVYFERQLLALKEDSRPYAMDPDTLETKGNYDFRGQYGCPTFTAHPKVDPATGELAAMGYEAKGDATTDVAYYLFSAAGEKLEECWFQAPFAGMMHDMGLTDRWVVFIVPPLAAVPLEKLKEGHKHFAWDDERPLAFGILSRRNPKPEDVKWFYARNAFYGHTGNTRPPPIPGGKFKSHYVRWKFDPSAADGSWVTPTELINLEGEMPKVDDRYLTKPYNTLFLSMTDTSLNRENAVIGGTYNSVARCDVNTGKYVHWCAGPDTALHEVAFCPRSPDAPEADGWVITVANRRDIKLTSIFILDTAKIQEGPIAIIELPFRLRAGIHGSWVQGRDLPEDKELCDMHGMTEDIRQEFEGTNVQTPFLQNGHTNGV
ncbi:putative lignostilbene dioxygenase protein [Neofusicoccum parvum UCRNP2]|uniref:Putative lignostilbene dioxygenase protein n=1 Tax=Botryosphaeria parva (strain UCR-NP2) TaxID=1287680 RepID=R1GH03_BOTPV|nr:putative lignostilbene dioxygenase protein [Neofusicoccum parvum UCRNP2]